MKTNVILNDGLNLVCDDVNLFGSNAYLHKHNLSPSSMAEILNACLSNGWECYQVNSTTHPRCLRIVLPTKKIKRFSEVRVL